VWKVFLDLFTVKMLVTFSRRPAAWFGLLSFPFWLGGFVGTGSIALLVAIGRHPQLVVIGSVTLLLACTAFHLLSLGFLAEFALEMKHSVQVPGPEGLVEAGQL
jgi:hypothetical protein